MKPISLLVEFKSARKIYVTRSRIFEKNSVKYAKNGYFDSFSPVITFHSDVLRVTMTQN